jgi:carbonic anhydrase
MKHLVKFIILSVTSLILTACSSSDGGNTTVADTDTGLSKNAEPTQNQDIHNPAEKVNDWQTALTFLKKGNQRYTSNTPMERTTNAEDRELLKDGQQPFAVIVTCSDSRVAPEIYLDQKLGDIFVIRNAGNIADKTTLGSIEYAVEHLHAPLVVVVGHSNCGAVTGAFEGGEFPPHLQSIISEIETSIKDSSDLDDAIHKNTDHVVQQIAEDEIIQEEGTKVIGAHYDILSGEVTWNE